MLNIFCKDIIFVIILYKYVDGEACVCFVLYEVMMAQCVGLNPYSDSMRELNLKICCSAWCRELFSSLKIVMLVAAQSAHYCFVGDSVEHSSQVVLILRREYN